MLATFNFKLISIFSDQNLSVIYTSANKFWRGIMDSPCPSVHPFVYRNNLSGEYCRRRNICLNWIKFHLLVGSVGLWWIFNP
jgi:hypothetical protein